VTITAQESFAPPSAAPAEEPSSSGSSGGQAGGQSPGAEPGGEQSSGEAEGESGGGQSGGEPEEVAGPSVAFSVAPPRIQVGESAVLRRDVENVREGYLDGQPVIGHETREVWPFPPSQTYILHVVLLSGEAQDYDVTVEVAGEVELVSGPDLAVLAVDAPDSRESDESVPFQAEVLNAGDTQAQGSQWRWSTNRSGDGPSSWNQGGRFNLEVGQTTILRGEAPPQPQGRWTLYVEVRVDGDDVRGNNGGADDFASINPAGGNEPNCSVLSVNVIPPESGSLRCPVASYFRADVEVDAPCTVSYRWERSDGVSENGSATVDRADPFRINSGSWDLEQSGTYWGQLHILGPNQMSSNRAEFTLTCQ